MKMTLQELTDFANTLADEAAAIIGRYFRHPVPVDHKSKEQPVTIADRAVEKKIRALIEARFPDDGIAGEEFGIKEGKNGRIWVLDPIDGTKSFIIGRPTFGTLIALWEGDTPLLGVIDQPISGERWIGAAGQATTFNGKPVRVRDCPDLGSARLASTSPLQLTPALIQAVYAKTNIVVWGGDCYLYGLLASGCLDVVVEQNLQPHDFAAIVPVVQGAGGTICDWDGQPLTLRSNGQVAAFGNSALKDEILSMLQPIKAAA